MAMPSKAALLIAKGLITESRTPEAKRYICERCKERRALKEGEFCVCCAYRALQRMGML